MPKSNPARSGRPALAYVLLALLAACHIDAAEFDATILNTQANVHPRLYLNAERIGALRREVQTTHAAMWETVRAQADEAAKKGPPAYRPKDNYSGDEQLWQREVGNAMPTLAMGYVLTGERKYLDSAKAWALASCGYETWGLGRYDGLDLATGHQLFGLAIIYDWCYADLDEQTRQTIRGTLVRRANAMFAAASTNKIYWSREYLQNHLWVNATGMAAAGFALFDEPSAAGDTTKWLEFSAAAFGRTMGSLGDDGASHEGAAYWEYGMEYMLKYMELSRDLLGVDLYKTPWFRHTADYALYLALPRSAWSRRGSIVDIGDSPRTHWYGPEYLLRALASEYHDGHAQWYAQQIERAGISTPSATWLNLLWYDPTVAATPPADLPTLRHFADMDIVSARSGWSGDESLLVFKCGPFIGHKAVEQFNFDPGGGHVHPDANHFVVFAGGQWLIRDDGYRAKATENHNTLLVDSKGQLGEGKMWFDGRAALAVKSRPRITQALSTATPDRISGDATDAYARSLGLKRYQRHLLFMKPDVLIVIDDIQTERVADLELRFHPEATAATQEGPAMLAATKDVNVRLDVLTPLDVKLSAENIRSPGRTGEATTDLFTIRLAAHRAQWRNATAITWSRGSAAPKVTLQTTPTRWGFRVRAREVSFEWDSK